MLNSQIKSTANPKCDTTDSRLAAFSLLCQLAKDSPQNCKILVDLLLQLHLSYDENLINEKFEFEREGRGFMTRRNVFQKREQNLLKVLR